MRTDDDTLRWRFQQNLPDYPFVVKEVCRRYALRQKYLLELGIVKGDGFDWRQVDIAGFKRHLDQHRIVPLAGKKYELWRLAKSNDASNKDLLYITNNLMCLQLVQFLNSVGDGVANLALLNQHRGAVSAVLAMGSFYRLSLCDFALMDKHTHPCTQHIHIFSVITSS